METVNRKRMRSDDSPYGIQSKVFINQQILDLNDEDRMKEIHKKTMNLLFKGAKNFNNNNKETNKYEMMKKVRLSGNGCVNFEENRKPNGFPEARNKSTCCQKMALISSECINCNLGLCEFCASSCSACGVFLCGACIDLFGCGTLEGPCCERCRMFI